MLPKFKKFAELAESEGTRSRCAGVMTLSSDLFWYIRHKEFAAKFLPDEKLYFTELPRKVE